MFDYRGYTDETLRRLCDQRRAFKGLYRRVYGPIEGYSFGRYYRDEAGYPHTLPLYVYSQHGAVYYLTIPRHEIENDAEAMLVWNTDTQREYQKISDKPCWVVTCPYISRRRRLGLVQAPEARGTLFFPAHSTKAYEANFNVDNYIAEILALPAEFQPVAVSLHTYDVRRGTHRRYLERGIPVYSAGDVIDVYFGDRLYEVMRHFRYTMSNLPGSYAYYSIEMGIPFSLWGEKPKYTAAPVGVVEHSETAEHQIAQRILSGFHTEVSREQKEFVEFSLGVGQGISREELGRIFWDAYRKRGRPMVDALTAARLRVKYGFKKFLYGQQNA